MISQILSAAVSTVSATVETTVEVAGAGIDLAQEFVTGAAREGAEIVTEVNEALTTVTIASAGDVALDYSSQVMSAAFTAADLQKADGSISAPSVQAAPAVQPTQVQVATQGSTAAPAPSLSDASLPPAIAA